MSERLPILTFHAINDGASPICFPHDLFRFLLVRLHENGYRTSGLSDAAMQLRQRSLPPRSIVLTFDDGDLSIYEKAWPVLQEFRMTATVFLLPGFYDGDGALRDFESRRLMNRRQIQEMSNAGVEFGAHTLTHPDLRRLSPDKVEQEVVQSKLLIEEMFGTSVSSFAYPFGSYDHRSYQIVKRHFTCACTGNLALAGAKDDQHKLPRVDAYYLRHKRLIDLMFSSSFSWYLLARAIPRGLRNMITPLVHRTTISPSSPSHAEIERP